MKAVMQGFDRQTSERFHEYDERMKTTRQKCKDKCDKEIQKIILKDKLEKQMEQQLITLETKIDTGDIPTCICEKSMADKMEKDCLRCTYGLGTLAPTVGLIGAVAVHAWKPTALKAAIAAALEANNANILAAANAAGIQAGKNVVIQVLKSFRVQDVCPEIFKSILKISHYNEVINFARSINMEYGATCTSLDKNIVPSLECKEFQIKFGIFRIDGNPGPPSASAIPEIVGEIVEGAKATAETTKTQVAAAKTATIKATQEKAIEAASMQLYTAIGYSITAILIIVLIMVIIYLILRYRRKKKMKKKLQYIKLLEE
ncbi:hypothetical protein PFMC_06096 [Plasmodium falciparum CAMP/Malaysia]|nr:hypothetical protein PFMC_06096 [Plasmodium falciparum CAMP/Malaysia]